ncbi:MAG: phloretin hydrolase [Lachnospiraceae bacterium]|nr:phloretin hydrolase [Lachnospiraceae bacterium]
MEDFMTGAKRVPVPEGSESKSYYKYYNRELLPIPDEKIEILNDPIGKPEEYMPIEDMNKLFDPGYLPGEIGIFYAPDGKVGVSNFTKMPGVTGEMAEWWFAWHGGEPLRYAIWDPLDHYGLELEPEDYVKIFDPSIPVAEKTRGVLHHVTESLVAGQDPVKCDLAFTDPAEFGMPVDKIHTDACSFVLCANVTIFTPEGMPNIPLVCVHFFRDTEDGCELRSRYWFGYQMKDGKPEYLLPDDPAAVPPLEVITDLEQHNFFEYTNLAAILANVYSEEKDNWKP